MKKTETSLLTGFRTEFILVLVAFVLLSGVEGIFQPLIVKSIFDEAVLKTNFQRFVSLAIVYVVLGLAINACIAGVSLWSKALENRIYRSAAARMLRAYYQLNYAEILERGVGYFIGRIQGDLAEGLIPRLRLIVSVASQIALVVGSSIVLFELSWQAFLVLLAVAPLAVLVSKILGKKVQELTVSQRDQSSALLNILSKALAAFRLVNMFGMVPQTVTTVDREVGQFLDIDYRTTKLLTLFQTANDATMVGCDFVSLFVGAIFVLHGKLSFGGYLAFVNCFWRSVTTILGISNQALEFQRLDAINTRILEFLALRPEGTVENTTDLRVNDASFAYGEATVLENLSIEVLAGERIALTGPNGSGKTTLANMISGFLSPSVGKVTRPERVSAVTLPIAFPPLRVRELPIAPELLTELGISGESLLDAYPDSLSSGQQQKVAIALGLSRPADLYVFDEPLANLDIESREAVIRLLWRYTEGRSLVLISHITPEAPARFDRRIDLRRGEDPRGSELIATGGSYRAE